MNVYLGLWMSRIAPPDPLKSDVGRSRFAENGPETRSNLKCNLTPSNPRDHSAKNHEVTWQ